jgi:hypothetical protein
VRAVRYLTLLAVCVGALAWVGAASALIVPQRSIAGIELQMTRPVGSPESALHDAYPRLHCRTESSDFRHCWTGRMRPGHRVTDYWIGIASGNVKLITVAFVID